MIAELEARRERRKPALLPAPDQRRSIRIAYGVSQKDIADVLGVSRLTVSMWERGQTEPKAEHAQKYAELLQSMSQEPAQEGTTDDQP
jgi:transcriptional regulator with XRE-family HTH domain